MKQYRRAGLIGRCDWNCKNPSVVVKHVVTDGRKRIAISSFVLYNFNLFLLMVDGGEEK